MSTHVDIKAKEGGVTALTRSSTPSIPTAVEIFHFYRLCGHPKPLKKRSCSRCKSKRATDPSRDSHLVYRLRACRKNAKIRGISFNLTLAELILLYNQQDHRCALTGQSFEPKYNFSIDRIDNSKGYFYENVQLVLLKINLAKHTMTPYEFMQMCKQVVDFNQTRSLIDLINPTGGASRISRTASTLPPDESTPGSIL